MNNPQNRRQSFRIQETVLLRYELLDDSEFDGGIARWRLRSGMASQIRPKLVDLESRLDKLMFRVSSESPAACDVLRLLNDKINIITQALPEFEQARQKLARKMPTKCELGSEGMLFGNDENLPVDTAIVLRFLVLPDNRSFEMFARVVNSRETVETSLISQKYETAVQFHGMSPPEREALIQYLFSRQSEALRLRRKEQESSDEENAQEDEQESGP